MFDEYSDIVAYSLLILFLVAMGLAAWLRYRILPRVRAAVRASNRSIKAGGSPDVILEQTDALRAISTAEVVDGRQLQVHTPGRDKAIAESNGAVHA